MINMLLFLLSKPNRIYSILILFISTFFSVILSSNASQANTNLINYRNDTLPKEISQNNIRVKASLKKPESESKKERISNQENLIVKIYNKGQLVITKNIKSFGNNLVVQLLEIDPKNNYPEVVIQSYSGGAHCCTKVQVLATYKNQGNNWQTIPIPEAWEGAWDQQPHPDRFSDLNGDGLAEFTSRDSRFLYRYSSYVGSVAPPIIYTIRSGNLVNVTKSPEYQTYIRERLNNLLEHANHQAFSHHGFLAGYVAMKILLNEKTEAWQVLLDNYNHEKKYCISEKENGKCLEKVSFPESLKRFLTETGYLSSQSSNQDHQTQQKDFVRLDADDPDSQITIRSQPSTNAPDQGYGLVGDRVKVLETTKGENGYTWYKVRFPKSGAIGWIRGNFIGN